MIIGLQNGYPSQTYWSNHNKMEEFFQVSKEERRELNLRYFAFRSWSRELCIFAAMHPMLWNVKMEPVLKSLRVTHVLSLEERFMGNMPARLRAMGVSHTIVPVEDFDAPTWEQVEEICKYLADRSSHDRILLHCRGGNGRTGTVLALLGIVFGTPASTDAKLPVECFEGTFQVSTRLATAIAHAREQDTWGLSVETIEQIQGLVSFEKNLTALRNLLGIESHHDTLN